MRSKAIVYCEAEFGEIDGKVANGLIRHSAKYEILGIIDSTKAGLDTGGVLDGVKNGIFVYKDIDDAINSISIIPEFFIYGIASNNAFLDDGERDVVYSAMKKGMNIVNGLPEFFTEDEIFVQKALENNVVIHDMRKAPMRKYLHNFTGKIRTVKAPIITILGTDCAVGKRTTSVKLVKALKADGLNVVFIATGQTGLLQGAKYGAVIDVLSSGFASGEIENAILKANDVENPDIFIVEGQGAISHPAYTSSHAIVRGSMPDAVILQHTPKRKFRCDFPDFLMPTVESEINLIETFSPTEVIGLTISHENMSDEELNNCIKEYEVTYSLPTTDVLKFGCEKLVQSIYKKFPELQKAKAALC
jgi:uncharacterized NAD-dependent epimerase/dehydratase family protein